MVKISSVSLGGEQLFVVQKTQIIIEETQKKGV